jgi:hypothetical protein
MKRKAQALKVVKKPYDIVEHTMRVRTRVLHLLKEEDFPPEAALGLFAGLAGMLGASQKHGRWRLLYRVWKLYGEERKRLFARHVKELTGQ